MCRNEFVTMKDSMYAIHGINSVASSFRAPATRTSVDSSSKTPDAIIREPTAVAPLADLYVISAASDTLILPPITYPKPASISRSPIMRVPVFSGNKQQHFVEVGIILAYETMVRYSVSTGATCSCAVLSNKFHNRSVSVP